MTRAVLFDADKAEVALRLIARHMHTPVVVLAAHLPAFHYVVTNATGDTRGFAVAVDARCRKGTTVVPDLSMHPELLKHAVTLIAEDLRFLVGVSLHHCDGSRSGSISLIGSEHSIAKHGVNIALLRQMGETIIKECCLNSKT